MSKIKIIDFHTHCFPDELAAKALSKLSLAPSGEDISYYTDGTLEGLKSSLRTAEIDLAVIQPVATKPQQVRKINDWAAANTGPPVIFFAGMHPDFSDWRQEFKRIKDLGFRGFKLHPDYQKFFVDEPRLFPFYEAAFDEDLFILFHAGVDVGLPPPYHCSPQRLARLLRIFPGAKIIAAHMGGYLYWEDVEQYLVGEDLYFDTAFSFAKMGKERMTKMILEHGPEKILFGTDSPWTDQGQELKNFFSLELSSDIKKKILSSNAAAILGI